MLKTIEIKFDREGTAYITKEECQITAKEGADRERFCKLLFDMLFKYSQSVSETENPTKSTTPQ